MVYLRRAAAPYPCCVAGRSRDRVQRNPRDPRGGASRRRCRTMCPRPEVVRRSLRVGPRPGRGLRRRGLQALRTPPRKEHVCRGTVRDRGLRGGLRELQRDPRRRLRSGPALRAGSMRTVPRRGRRMPLHDGRELQVRRNLRRGGLHVRRHTVRARRHVHRAGHLRLLTGLGSHSARGDCPEHRRRQRPRAPILDALTPLPASSSLQPTPPLHALRHCASRRRRPRGTPGRR